MNAIITLRENEVRLFWSKIVVKGFDECWEWFPNVDKFGYGKFHIHDEEGKRITVRVHRFSWFLKFGPIPDGLCVCHKCDNRKCVNWNHLFLGTLADNNVDRMKKGRGVHGEKQRSAKLKEKDIPVIRKMISEGKNYGVIGKIFGVSDESIGGIARGKYWKHVKQE